MTVWKGWTEEAFEKAKALWAAGKTATQIAGVLGCTRNAVLSKIHRHNCAQRSIQQAPRQTGINRYRIKPKMKVAPDKPAHPKVSAISAIAMFGDAEPIIEHEEIVVPPDQRRKLVDLEADNCRWPIGDPRAADFHFCNGKKVPGLSYCEHHVQRAYQPIQPKRKPSNDNAPKSPTRVKEVENV